MPVQRMSSSEIYLDLRSRILRREVGYQSGDRLPSQQELAELYSVHRATISRAMLLLAHDGLVRGRGGAGTEVIGLPDIQLPGEDYLPDHS